MLEPHDADGHLVLSVTGTDGLRWACRTCNATVHRAGGPWQHFDPALNPTPPRTQEP